MHQPSTALLGDSDFGPGHAVTMPSIYVSEIRCPGREQKGSSYDSLLIVNSHVNPVGSDAWHPSDVWPDLLITVNFTTIRMNGTSLVNNRRRAVSLVIGLTDNMNRVLNNTIPIPLLPNAHLIGAVTPSVRSQYKEKPVVWNLIHPSGVSRSSLCSPHRS